MEALVVDSIHAELNPSVNTEKKRRNDMYYETDRGPIAIMSLLKPEHHNEIQDLLKEVRQRRDALREYEYKVFVVIFRDFRI